MNTTQTRKMDATQISQTVLNLVAVSCYAAVKANAKLSEKAKRSWLNAACKATDEIVDNPRWSYADGELLILSRKSDKLYRVTNERGCQCEAAQNKSVCYHFCALRLIERYIAALDFAVETKTEGAQATSAPVEQSAYAALYGQPHKQPTWHIEAEQNAAAEACALETLNTYAPGWQMTAEERERLFAQADELVRRNCRCSQDEGGVVYRCDWCKMSEEAQEEARQIRFNGAQPSPFKSHAPVIHQSPLKAYYDTETRKLEQALRAEDASGVGANLRKLSDGQAADEPWRAKALDDKRTFVVWRWLPFPSSHTEVLPRRFRSLKGAEAEAARLNTKTSSNLDAANAATFTPVTQQGEKYGRFDI